MARRSDLVKGKTNYVLRNKHAEVKKGTIFEEDYLTIRPDDGLFSDDYYVSPHSNFKFKSRYAQTEKKRHIRGQFIKPEGSTSNVWTLNDVSSAKTSESKIELRPNYNSLSDFACYGSATQLIHGAVTDVIMRFPGGLSFYDKDQMEKYEIDGEVYYRISNEFQIDIDTEVNATAVERPMKYLSASYTEYVNKNGNAIDKPSVTKYGAWCNNTIIGESDVAGLTIYIYLDGNEKIYLAKEQDYGSKGEVIIRPKQQYIDDFFNNLDDFEKVLLDRTTVPVYKATFNTPYETENGVFYQKKAYIWPTIGDDFTPDLTTQVYESYIQSLISLGEYYDEHYSDNIWRMLTHESIKNLDWTFMKGNVDENMEEEKIDSSRIHAVIDVYGRTYDDIKRYADNIKTSNSISYDRQNNTPDYFLSDSVESDGWESLNVGPSNDNSLRTDIIYSGSSRIGSTSYEANIDFFRTLSLNSDYIQSLKGTRRGIETVLGLFGLKNNTDYEIKEYVAIASGSNTNMAFPTASEMVELRPNPYFDDDNDSDSIYDAYPVIRVTPANGGEDYMIPWFIKTTLGVEDMYFQGKGGWERRVSKDIDLAMAPNVHTITETSDFQLYNETEPYMKFASNLDDMKELIGVKDGTVCYVEDLTKLFDEYKFRNEEEAAQKDYFSHYFVLENNVLKHTLGFINNNRYNCYGWRNVLTTEYENPNTLTEDGMRVLNLEATKSIRTGNNPHIGRGLYDDGDDYLNYYKTIYRKEIENGDMALVDVSTDEGMAMYNRILQFGFNVKMVRDDKKCFAFADTLDTSSSLRSIGTNTETWEEKTGYSSLVNPENGPKYDEAAANSVINVKNIEIDFKTIGKGGEYFKKYVNDVIIKYVEQMMPTTAVFRYGFDNEFNAVLISAANTTSIYENGDVSLIVADAASNDDDGDIFYIEDISNAIE